MCCDMNDTWSQEELRGQFLQNSWTCIDYNAGGLQEICYDVDSNF